MVLFPELEPIRMMASVLWARLQATRDDERGMTTEMVIITAALAALALVATKMIYDKVTAKADSIPTQ